MKQFLAVLTVIILLLLLVGTFFGDSDTFVFKNGTSLAILLVAFVWMPVFLFYAYDRRRQKKESNEE